MSALVNIPLLEKYVDNNQNVLFEGEHGVGKSAIVNEIFNKKFGEMNKDWLYFSASTMDPWVDLIGLPKEKTDALGNTYIDLIPPKRFVNGEVKGIFLDEYNRSDKKLKNAIMELIQFKSINGNKFPKLQCVWAAINPQDDQDTYSVDEIDPAQLDRFHVHIKIPTKLDTKLLIDKHSDIVAKPFIEWWHKLSDKNKKLVSPRRLDYSIQAFKDGGDLRHYLNKQTNVTALVEKLSKVKEETLWNELLNKTEEEKITFFSNPSNVDEYESKIVKNYKDLAKYIPDDLLISKIKSSNRWKTQFVNNVSSTKTEVFQELTEEAMKHNKMLNTYLEDIISNKEDNFDDLKETSPDEYFYDHKTGKELHYSKLNLEKHSTLITGKLQKTYCNKNGKSYQKPSKYDISTILYDSGYGLCENYTSQVQYVVVTDDAIKKQTASYKRAKNEKRLIPEYIFWMRYGNMTKTYQDQFKNSNSNTSTDYDNLDYSSDEYISF